MLEELVEKEIITSKQVQQIQEFYQEKKKAKSEKYANKRIIPMEESDMDSYKDKRSAESTTKENNDLFKENQQTIAENESPFKSIIENTPIKTIRSQLITNSQTNESDGNIKESMENPKIIELVEKDKLSKPENSTPIVYSILMYLNPQLNKKTWIEDMSFFENCRLLACFYPELIIPLLGSILSKCCELCNSLQSAVIKSALITLTDLIDFLGVFLLFNRIMNNRINVL